jgi:DNA-binding response OmpR family regulator
MTAMPSSHREVLIVGPLEIFPHEKMAWAMGRGLMLTVRELSLLTELARRVDRPVSREELYTLVWGRAMRSGDRTIDVYVRRLRVKLEAALPEWRFIHTHFATGYRLTAEPAAWAHMTRQAPRLKQS